MVVDYTKPRTKMYNGNGIKSIIVIVYNQLEYTKKCIEHIFKYTTAFELIVWHNGLGEEYTKSTTIYLDELQKRNKNVVVLSSPTNLGFTKPCNECAKIAKGDYLIFVNNDLIVSPEWTEKLAAPFLRDKMVGQTGVCGRGIGDYGQAILSKRIEYIDGGLFCISKEVYDKFGLFDEQIEFAYCEDQDLSLKLLSNQYKLVVVPVYVVHKRAVTRHSVHNIDFNAIEVRNRLYVQHKWADYFRTRKWSWQK